VDSQLIPPISPMVFMPCNAPMDWSGNSRTGESRAQRRPRRSGLRAARSCAASSAKKHGPRALTPSGCRKKSTL